MTDLRNRLLASLPPAIVGELVRHLRPVQFAQEHILYRAGERVARVYFPETGLVSYLVEVAGGDVEHRDRPDRRAGPFARL